MYNFFANLHRSPTLRLLVMAAVACVVAKTCFLTSAGYSEATWSVLSVLFGYILAGITENAFEKLVTRRLKPCLSKVHVTWIGTALIVIIIVLANIMPHIQTTISGLLDLALPYLVILICNSIKKQ